MSWLFSRALVEEFSEAACSDGEQSALSNSNPTLQAFCSPDKMMVYSRLSQSGMTYAPLTDDHGKDLLTWYQEAFLVKTFQSQEKDPALTVLVPGFGGKCTELLAKYDLDMSLWRTLPCSPRADLDIFSVTWPRAGMMRNGLCWGRTTWKPHMSGNVFGYLLKLPSLTKVRGEVNETPVRKSKVRMLPTLTCQDAKNNGGPSQLKRNSPPLNALVGGPLNPTWCEWLMGWPLEWTALKPLEMDKFQQWRRLHSRFYSEDYNMRKGKMKTIVPTT